MSNTVPRVLLGVLIAVLGTASFAMMARYGFLQAQDDLDKIIADVMAGAIALCAVVFHGIAIRLWLQGARKTAGLIGIIGVTDSPVRVEVRKASAKYGYLRICRR